MSFSQLLSSLAPDYTNQPISSQIIVPSEISKLYHEESDHIMDYPKSTNITPKHPPQKPECSTECPIKKPECPVECPIKKPECPVECPVQKPECPVECPVQKSECSRVECNPCVTDGYRWGWFGALVLWFIVFTILFWLIYYSLKPSFVLQTDSNQVDTSKVLLYSLISALILVLLIWLIKLAVNRYYYYY